MSCINVNIRMLNTPVKLSVEKTKSMSVITNSLIEPLFVLLQRIDESSKVAITNITQALNVKCSIVCSIGDIHYLNVTPKDIQWITPDYGIVYTVESDTEWKIIVTS